MKQKLLLSSKYQIIALNDKQAVLVEGENWKIVGKGEKVTFNKFGTP